MKLLNFFKKSETQTPHSTKPKTGIKITTKFIFILTTSFLILGIQTAWSDTPKNICTSYANQYLSLFCKSPIEGDYTRDDLRDILVNTCLNTEQCFSGGSQGQTLSRRYDKNPNDSCVKAFLYYVEDGPNKTRVCDMFLPAASTSESNTQTTGPLHNEQTISANSIENDVLPDFSRKLFSEFGTISMDCPSDVIPTATCGLTFSSFQDFNDQLDFSFDSESILENINHDEPWALAQDDYGNRIYNRELSNDSVAFTISFRPLSSDSDGENLVVIAPSTNSTTTTLQGNIGQTNDGAATVDSVTCGNGDFDNLRTILPIYNNIPALKEALDSVFLGDFQTMYAQGKAQGRKTSDNLKELSDIKKQFVQNRESSIQALNQWLTVDPVAWIAAIDAGTAGVDVFGDESQGPLGQDANWSRSYLLAQYSLARVNMIIACYEEVE